MRKTKRSAFTIVELVIVIAVIAILSAVLIPTFGAIIKNANVAADQSAAASLTTELHIYLKGETIDSEAELMDALDKSGIGEKLVPKAAQYGYHFWFDMENQMIVAESSDIVESKVPVENNNENLSVQKGPALMSEIIAQNNDSINFSFRDIYGIGWYLIDNNTTLGNVVNALTDKTTNSDTFQNNVLNVLKSFEIEDALCGKLIEEINKTIIVTNNGTFHPANATQIAFAQGVTVITSTQYQVDATNGTVGTPAANLPLPSGQIIIPSSVTCIADKSLYFTGAKSVNLEIEESKLGMLCENSTNATINGKYTVEGDKLMEGDTVKDTIVSIEGRFPAYEFGVLAQDDLNNNTYAWNNGTLYLSYYAFINQAESLELLLTADGESVLADTVGYVTWETDSGNVSVGNILDGDNTIYNVLSAAGNDHVTGTVTLLDGTDSVVEFDVVIVNPESAEVILGSHTAHVPYTGLGQGFEWYYDGTNISTTVNVGEVTYSSGFAHGTPSLELEYDADVFKYENGVLSLNTDTNGNLTVKKNDDGTTKERYDITLTVDGIISSVTTVTLKDFTNARLVSNFNQKHEAPYYRYIGNGAVKLNRLMKLSGEYIPYDSRIVIEAAAGNNVWLPITSMSGFEMTCSGTSVTPVYNEDGSRIIAWEFAGKNWENVTLDLSKGNPDVALRVKITPISATESEDNTIVLELKYVNAKNVDSISGLSAAATENVVLMSDLEITSNATKITVGNGVTLYGNGFIISAPTYKAELANIESKMANYSFERATACNYPACPNYGKKAVKGTCYKDGSCGSEEEIHATKANQSFMTVSEGNAYTAYKTNQALITLDGGTIDNVYINGPVYPNLQYYMDDSYSGNQTVSTGYYVSGIKVSSTGTIQNSYVSGFRQPVSAQGTALSIDNTTLSGGNYANLQVVTGSLNLNNVTTVQNPDGTAATVDNVGKLVIGLGVAIESGALQSTINITGYLNQYNWVPENTEATLPTISGINLDEIFSYAFNGIDAIIIQMKISRFLEFMHLDESGEQYFNAGFIFANIGNSATINTLPDFKKPTETNRDYVDENGFTTGSALGKITVRLSALSGNDTVDKFVMGQFGNADGLVYIYTYKDNRKYDYSKDEVDNNATDWDTVITLSDDEDSVHPITYEGYYTNYGN